jgi:ankyrin repeat protein
MNAAVLRIAAFLLAGLFTLSAYAAPADTERAFGAVDNGRVRAVRAMLEDGMSPDLIGPTGYTLLHRAAQFGHHEITLLLLQAGAQVNMPTRSYGNTPLHSAVFYATFPLVRALLDKGAAVDVANLDGHTPLHFAGRSSVEIVDALLVRGADVHRRDAKQKTALHSAAFNGNAEIIARLLAAGASIEARDDAGETPLFIAAKRGGLAAVQTLVKAGADVNARRTDGANVLIATFPFERTIRVEHFLLGSGVNLEAADGHGRTLVFHMAEAGLSARVADLARRGAALDKQDSTGMTALAAAAAKGRGHTVRALAALGSRIDAADRAGMTALMHAAANGHATAVETLLDLGADPGARDHDGKTALTYATEKNHEVAARVLVPRAR